MKILSILFIVIVLEALVPTADAISTVSDDMSTTLFMKFNDYSAEQYEEYLSTQSAMYRRSYQTYGTIDGIDLGATMQYTHMKDASEMFDSLCEDSFYVMGITQIEWDRYREYAAGGIKLVESELYDWMYNGQGVDPGDSSTPVEMDEYYLFELTDAEGKSHSVVICCYSLYAGGDDVSVKEVSPWTLRVTEEKGKTIAHISRHGEKGTEYSLKVINDQGDGVLKEKEFGTYKIGKESAFDFSTEIGLESGTAHFYASKQGTAADPEVVGTYKYDEKKKVDDDDAFGNEREFRRLMTFTEEPNWMLMH